MKTLQFFALFAFAIGFTQATYAQCGATSVSPSPQVSGNCSGETDTISFSAAGTCGGLYEYQVEGPGPVILQAWSPNPQFIVTPTVTTTYTIYARCPACPTIVVSDTFLIEVIEAPVITADTFVCYGTSAQFTATGPIGNMSWWDAPGGSQLSPDENYTTPPMTQDETFIMEVVGTVSAGTGQGSILITECGLEGFAGGAGSEDYIEISNLYNTPINTAGWTCAVSSSYTIINNYNTTTWSLPTNFAPCSIVSRTDNNGQSNYWGSNILWNPNNNGWAMVIDDVGNVVDFVCWGWSAADVATLSITLNGFPITIGPEWTTNGVSASCNTVGGVPYSISRIGTNDSNTAGDFVCQATSLDALNPALSCGWVAQSIGCPYPITVEVDMPPTASNPATTSVACYGDVPAVDPAVVIDELDDHTVIPTVVFLSEVSDGLSCPETLTRTYRVSDSCSNYVDVAHRIRIFDSITPIMDPAPLDVTVSCYANVPPITDLNWSDNCLGTGIATGVEVSSGTTCPETLTRTWTITDTCGNTATRTQIITIHDQQAPVIDPAPASVNITCYASVPLMVPLNWTDNCSGAGVLNGTEVSDGQTCPETLTRTWTISDGCGNTSTETQVIVIHDTQAPIIDPAPASVNVQCYGDVPAMVSLNWSDNCTGVGVLNGTEVSDGQSCPETITRTWTISDNCGNTATETQIIVVHDITPPTASSLPFEIVGVLPPPDLTLLSDAADNCGTPTVVWVDDVSDNGYCPENVVRTYSVSDDCGNELLITQDFQIGDNIPLINFTASETIITNANLDDGGLINFTNNSSGAVSYLWDFDDSTTSTNYSTSHNFDNTTAGGYYVTLYGISEYGCVDSASVVIQVRVELLYYIPNTFTPDGDEFNQTFQPVFESGFDAHDWNMTIYNRWGEIVFESNDHSVGWDGTYGGEIVQQGTYTYKIEFGLEYTDAREIITGHVNILK